MIKTGERKLYLVLENGQTLAYPWESARLENMDGRELHQRKIPQAGVVSSRGDQVFETSPASFERRAGKSDEVAAMTLSSGGEYAIHGTNNPGSIGGFVSFGCIRVHNSDIMDLYRRGCCTRSSSCGDGKRASPRIQPT